jgi:hypothetical protein
MTTVKEIITRFTTITGAAQCMGIIEIIIAISTDTIKISGKPDAK